MMMFNILYSARNDNNVVNEAAPAIKGNTSRYKSGRIRRPVVLNISIPKIISTAKTKITKAPAMAKEEMSTLNKASKEFPTNKKATSMTKEKMAAFSALIVLFLAFKAKIMGIDPSISITAKSTIKALNISLKLK